MDLTLLDSYMESASGVQYLFFFIFWFHQRHIWPEYLLLFEAIACRVIQAMSFEFCWDVTQFCFGFVARRICNKTLLTQEF